MLLEAQPLISRAAPSPHVPEKKTRHQEVSQDLKDKVMPFWFSPFFLLYTLCILYTYIFLCGKILVVTKTNLEPPKTPHCPVHPSEERSKHTTSDSQPSKALHTTPSPHSARKQQNLGEMTSPVCPEMFLPAPSPPPIVSGDVSISVWV